MAHNTRWSHCKRWTSGEHRHGVAPCQWLSSTSRTFLIETSLPGDPLFGCLHTVVQLAMGLVDIVTWRMLLDSQINKQI